MKVERSTNEKASLFWTKKVILYILGEKRVETKKCQKDYYSSEIAGQKSNPKKAWKSINSLLFKQNKPTLVYELTVGNNTLTCPEDIAESFDEYF